MIYGNLIISNKKLSLSSYYNHLFFRPYLTLIKDFKMNSTK